MHILASQNNPHVPTVIKSCEKCAVNFEFNPDFSSTSQSENYLNSVDENNSSNMYIGCEINAFITPLQNYNNDTYSNVVSILSIKMNVYIWILMYMMIFLPQYLL